MRLSNPGTPWMPLLAAQYCLHVPGGNTQYPEWCNETAANAFNLETYPFMLLMSNGRVVCPGS